MIVLGLDPGTYESALVAFNGAAVRDHRMFNNALLIDYLEEAQKTDGQMVLVIEQVESFGMAVGKEVFETVFWSGRFAQQWRRPFDRLPRRIVKQQLCHTARATDANIRQALIDRFGPQGTKKEPGLLYGIKSHEWAALAVAVTWWDLHGAEPADIRPGVKPDF